MSEVTPAGFILRCGKKAIRVLAEGDTWEEAISKALERLKQYKTMNGAAKLLNGVTG